MKFLDELLRIVSPQRRRELGNVFKSPQKILEQIEYYLKERDLESALHLVKIAEDRFPGDRNLSRVIHHVQREEQKRELESILVNLSEKANPVLYARAADLYVQLGQMDHALRIAEEGRAAFPEKDDPYFIVGRIRWERFRKDLLIKDGREALENLKKAIHLNPQNLSAHCQLGELYLALGWGENALAHFTRLREGGPLWANLNQRIKEAKKLQSGMADEEEVDGSIREVELQNQFPFPFWDSQQDLNGHHTPPSRGTGLSTEKVSTFKEEEVGIQHAFFVQEGSSDPAQEEPIPLAKGIEKIASYAGLAARRMDLGSLQDGTLEGPFGTMAFRSVDGGLLVLLGDLSVRGEQALQLLEEWEEKGRQE